MILLQPCSAKVFRTSFWMSGFGSPTPKRTLIAANSSWISMLETGAMVRKFIDAKESDKTCEQYVDSNGVVRYKGAPGLKRSQKLGQHLITLSQYFPNLFILKFYQEEKSCFFQCMWPNLGCTPRNLQEPWLNSCTRPERRPEPASLQWLVHDLIWYFGFSVCSSNLKGDRSTNWTLPFVRRSCRPILHLSFLCYPGQTNCAYLRGGGWVGVVMLGRMWADRLLDVSNGL